MINHHSGLRWSTTFSLRHLILTSASLYSLESTGYSIKNQWKEQFLAVFLNTGSFFYITAATKLWNSISTPPWATANMCGPCSWLKFLFRMMCSSTTSFRNSQQRLLTSIQLSPFSHLYSRMLLCSLSAICFQVIKGLPSKMPPLFSRMRLVSVVGIFSRYLACVLMQSKVATVLPRSETQMWSKCTGWFLRKTPIFLACSFPVLVSVPGCCPQIVLRMLSSVYPCRVKSSRRDIRSFSIQIKLIRMIDRVIEINGKEIVVGQDLTLSHAGTVWDGALTMVYYWNKNQQIAKALLEGKTVLELGSGTGVVGISAAIFSPKSVFLTDLPEYLKILQINQQKNLNLSTDPACLKVRKLEWENQLDIDSITGIDTLIGSELAYDKENVIRLMNTIRHYRAVNPKLKIMIAYQKYAQEWKNLESKFNEYFPGQFQVVGWEDFDEDYRDPHIGILFME